MQQNSHPQRGRGRHYDGWLSDIQVEAAIKGRGKVEKDAFLAHLFKLFVGYIVAVFDGIGTGIGKGVRAGKLNFPSTTGPIMWRGSTLANIFGCDEAIG